MKAPRPTVRRRGDLRITRRRLGEVERLFLGEADFFFAGDFFFPPAGVRRYDTRVPLRTYVTRVRRGLVE